MLSKRYSYIFLVFGLLAGVSWIGQRVESEPRRNPAAAAPSEAPAVEQSRRLAVVELLERIVSYQHYYRSVYGHFTKLLGRTGFTIPREVSELYEVRVEEATTDRLVVTALSEVNGHVMDRVTIDEDYRVKGTFALPQPRAEYLTSKALRHLRVLEASPTGRLVDETGIFKGYFSYDVRTDSEGRRRAFAVGVRAPVVGVQLEAARTAGEEISASGLSVPGSEEETLAVSGTGQRSIGNVMSTLEEAYLAQKIFHGEMGRYAKNWSELSQIASFRFEDKERYDLERVPVRTTDVDIQDVDDGELVADNVPVADRQVASKDQLEIEPIEPQRSR